MELMDIRQTWPVTLLPAQAGKFKCTQRCRAYSSKAVNYNCRYDMMDYINVRPKADE